ncbi:MAG: hypothetical protein JSR24_20250 [Proteobacteria bacterium]|nr:hypothetical protein [Pseudomonadota bacterium]
MRAQIARTAPTLAADADRIVTAILDSGRVPADMPAELRPVFPAYAGPFLRDLFAFDPAAALARLDTPCLLIHGGADSLIVPFADIQPLIDGLGKRNATGEALVVPAVSHNLKTVYNGTDPGYIGALAPAVGDKLAQWLGDVLGA